MSGFEFNHWADVIAQYGFPVIAMICNQVILYLAHLQNA